MATAWQLGGRPYLGGLRLRLWAHTLGYRGHWATRSRHYSRPIFGAAIGRGGEQSSTEPGGK